LDVRLIEYLDDQDWELLVGHLALTATSMMRRFGWRLSREEVSEKAHDFAVETVITAYDAAIQSMPGRYDPGRADPNTPEETRFFHYLTLNILRRKISGAMKKSKRLAQWLGVPYEDDIPASECVARQASELLLGLMDQADEDLQVFISAVNAQICGNPQAGRVNWTSIRCQLDISRYMCDQLREKLEKLLAPIVFPQ